MCAKCPNPAQETRPASSQTRRPRQIRVPRHYPVPDIRIGARELLGEDYWKGERIGADFAASEASYLPGATVWQLSPDLELGISAGGRTAMIEARQVV